MNRRTLLHGFAAAGATGLMSAVAGCMGGGDGNGGGGGGGGGSTTAGGSDGGGETTAGGQTTMGGGTEPSGETTTGGATTGGGTGGPTVTVSSHPELGDILVGSNGMTLYLFTEDSGSESACYGDCASAWPPLTVEGEPTAGSGVTADLGTITRRNGSTQVTAAGHPLYYYTPDEQPDDATGQGVGGVWYVLAPDGSRISDTGSETTTGTTSGGTGGDDGTTDSGGIDY